LKQDEVFVEMADFGTCCTATHEITAGQRVAVEPLLNCSSCRTCCGLSRGG
jgi:threonine dehydrogenase-like Zn-dependent dehydrogenase